MELSPSQQWATNWGRSKGLLSGNETATGGLLNTRIGGNSRLRGDFDSGLKTFNTTTGVRPTTIASQNPYQQQSLYEMGQGTGQVQGKVFNPYIADRKASIDAARGAVDRLATPYKAYDQNDAAQFMNPYIQQVIDINARDARLREAERRKSINESFAEAGGFGSTALGLERSRNAMESERGISDMDAQMRAQGFDMATGRNMQLYEGNRADDFARKMGQVGGYLNAASAYGGAMNDAMGLDAYGRSVANMNVDRRLAAGDRIQAQNQAELDAYYNADAIQRQFPYTQNQFLADILARYPTGTQATSSTPGVGLVQGALGGASIGTSLSNAFSNSLPWQATGNTRPSYLGGGFY